MRTLIAMILVLCSINAMAETFEEEEVQFSTDLITNLKEEVAENNPTAMAYLGISYLEGVGVEQDMEHGFELIKKSADYGNLTGMEFLAVCYLTGKGVEIDKEQGFYWIVLAAQSGSRDAMYAVGLIYQYGKYDKPVSTKDARYWFVRAARMGHEDAMAKLKNM